MERILRAHSRYFSPFVSGKGPLSPIYKRSLRKRDSQINPQITRSVESLRKCVSGVEPKPRLGIGFGALAELQPTPHDLKPLTSRKVTRHKTSSSPIKKGLQLVNFPSPLADFQSHESVRLRQVPISLSRGFLRFPRAYRRYTNRPKGVSAVLKSSPQGSVTDRVHSTSLFHNKSIRERVLAVV